MAEQIMTVQEYTRKITIEILAEHFADIVSRKLIERSVMAGDPGEWSPNALATITTENGLPNPNYEDYTLWEQMNDDFEEYGLYFDIVNMAIIGIYAL